MNHPYQRAALVIAHPGHELKVHGRREAARPRVFVLTDGSGRSSQSRLSSTTAVLNQAGANRGTIYGRLTDSAAYAAILNHEFTLFIDLAQELAGAFVAERIDLVAGDAFEGYNPMHDVCRLVINAAVRSARQARGDKLAGIANMEFSLVSQPDACPAPAPADEIWFQLDEPALERKIAAARGYTELAGEVFDALGRASVHAFGVERLRPAEPDAGLRCGVEEPPFYEQYGEKQVAAGYYARVLRYDEHIAPLAEALRRYGTESVKRTSDSSPAIHRWETGEFRHEVRETDD
jgi:hypothetical protein